MAAAQHFFPNFQKVLAQNKSAALNTDTLTVGLISAGTYTWGATPQTANYVSDFLAGDGTHGALTEVSTSGTGYTRQNLASVTYTVSGLVNTLSATSPAWSSATFTALYAFLFDTTVGTGDASHPIIAYWDFGGAQSVTSATFTLIVGANGLITWTAS